MSRRDSRLWAWWQRWKAEPEAWARQPWQLRACGLVAEGCVALAVVLYFLVTCAPEAELRRSLVCGALALAGIGGIVARRPAASPVLRRWGLLVFGVGIATVVVVLAIA